MSCFAEEKMVWPWRVQILSIRRSLLRDRKGIPTKILVCFFPTPSFIFFEFPMLLKQPTYFFCLPVIFIANTLRGVGVFLLPEVFVGSKVSKLDLLTNLNPFMHSDWWFIGWCLVIWFTHIISNGSSGGLFCAFCLFNSVKSRSNKQQETKRPHPFK